MTSHDMGMAFVLILSMVAWGLALRLVFISDRAYRKAREALDRAETTRAEARTYVSASDERHMLLLRAIELRETNAIAREEHARLLYNRVFGVPAPKPTAKENVS